MTPTRRPLLDGGASPANDPLLRPLLEAGGEEDRASILQSIMEAVAAPIIDQVLRRQRAVWRHLRSDDLDDLRNTIKLRLLQKLRALEDDPGAAIANFRGYVATLAHHSVQDAARQRFPERNRLKHRVRNIISADPRLAAWPAETSTLCGLRRWEGRSDPAEPSVDSVPPDRGPADTLVAMFERSGKPAELDALVDALASLWGVVEPVTEAVPELTDPAPTPHAVLERRRALEQMWQEIRDLRPLQRAALLLNLRDADGGNATALFLLLGVADLEEISEAVSMPPQKLAEVWGTLPLDDLSIAGMLGHSRQQIINLRRSARERLARRLGTELAPR